MKKHVLIVEDSIPVMKISKMLIESLGCSVDCAPTGEDALEMVDDTKYDLILMDLGLPGIDGIETTQEIRHQESSVCKNAVPIIAVTGDINPIHHKQCLRAGMNDVFIKPLTKEDIRYILSSACCEE